MNIAIALLRLIHIFSGVFWAGSVFALSRFIEPAAAATQPESNKFVQRFMGGGYVIAQAFAGPLTVLAGLILYWIDSGGLQNGWITTPTGLGFTVGAIAALVAFYIGFFISRTSAESMTALGKEIQTAGKPPTSEQMSKMKALQERLTQASVGCTVTLKRTIGREASSTMKKRYCTCRKNRSMTGKKSHRVFQKSLDKVCRLCSRRCLCHAERRQEPGDSQARYLSVPKMRIA